MRKKKSDVPMNQSTSASVEKKQKAPKVSAPKVYVGVDYPVEGEIVSSPSYTFRIGASAGGKVEVSFDGKQWLGCRDSAGYYWFDWSGYGAGPRTLRARILAPGRPPLKSKPRNFTVLI